MIWMDEWPEDSAMYGLMCEVANGERSDWPIGLGEPTHDEYMRLGAVRAYLTMCRLRPPYDEEERTA